MPNKTVLDKRLPAPSRNDFRSYNHKPQVDGAPPVGASRPQTFGHESMRILWLFLAGLTGAAIGLFLGTVGIFYGCVLYDQIAYPNSAGGGLVAVGWIFLLITAPGGFIIGAILGIVCLLLIWRRAERRSRE
jgi:hypothetical protein